MLPWTHALALMRYGLVGGSASGLRAIWGQHSETALAMASLAVVMGSAALLLVVATRVFRRSAMP